MKTAAGGHPPRVDVATERVTGLLGLPAGEMPQDVKLTPDGRVYYVPDMALGGMWIIDAARPRVLGFVATGKSAHGLYVSRDARYLFVSNCGEGSVSLVSFASRKVVTTWRLPSGGSPDLGGVSADGRLLAHVPVGRGPHGLCVSPQPGRYSLGHTGVFR